MRSALSHLTRLIAIATAVVFVSSACEGAPTYPKVEQQGGNQATNEKAPQAEEPPPAPEQEQVQHAESPYKDTSFRVTISATFSDLPKGARIIAPSARDGRYQKVMRSEHSGVTGGVMPAEDGHNLFFVSNEVSGKGDVKYTASFDVRRRVGSQGSLQATADTDWSDEMPKVEGASADGNLAKIAGELGEARQKPHAELLAVLGRTVKLATAETGSSDPTEVAAGKPASTLGVARTMAELLRLRGLAARVVQGLYQPDVPGTAKQTHAWNDVNMPRLTWVPVDPVLRQKKSIKEADPTYLGLLPADRLTLAYGDSAVLPDDGTFPRTTLTGQLAAPFALKDGQRVGKVDWVASFEKLGGR